MKKNGRVKTNLTAEETTAYNLLKELRTDNTSYQENLQRIVNILGSDFEIQTDEFAKGLLIALITQKYSYGDKRDLVLISLGLLSDYNQYNISIRREMYIKKANLAISVDAVRKKEDKLLAELIHELSHGIKESKDYLANLLNFADASNFLIYDGARHTWRAWLPSFHEDKASRQSFVYKETITLTDMEERRADEIHQRILDGEKVINTLYLSLTGSQYIGNCYWYKYHQHHDLFLSVYIENYEGLSKISITISEMISNDEMCSIHFRGNWEDVKLLADATKRPLFNYNYEGDQPDDYKIFHYLAHKGVVFCIKDPVREILSF